VIECKIHRRVESAIVAKKSFEVSPFRFNDVQIVRVGRHKQHMTPRLRRHLRQYLFAVESRVVHDEPITRAHDLQKHSEPKLEKPAFHGAVIQKLFVYLVSALCRDNIQFFRLASMRNPFHFLAAGSVTMRPV